MLREQPSEFIQKLAQVRSMPQEFGTSEESQDDKFKRERRSTEKRDAARILRMEVLLDNAKCARVMVLALEENPKISVEDLQNLLAQQVEVIHPEVAATFAAELVTTSQRVQETIAELKIESSKKRQGMAMLLYHRLLIEGLRKPNKGEMSLPKGEVRLGGTYPLAVQLDVIDDADYQALTEERVVRVTKPADIKQARGFNKQSPKKDSLAEMFRELAGNNVDFPVIVVCPGRTEPGDRITRRHEQGHSQHTIFEKVLEAKGKKFIWGEPEWDGGVSNAKLEKLWNEDESKARNSIYWIQIQQKATACAKREFFADAAAGQGNLLDASSMNSLQYNAYDYFKALGINPKSNLHKALRQEYLQTLESAAEQFSDVVKGYYALGLGERAELMVWVGAQIPLDQWSRQFAGANFQLEANRLRRIARFYSAGLEDDDETEKERRKDLINNMISEMKTQQDKPLIPILDRYEKKFNIPEDFH